MSDCLHCGGTGVLRIIATVTIAPPSPMPGEVIGGDVWDGTPYDAPCHECDGGSSR